MVPQKPITPLDSAALWLIAAVWGVNIVATKYALLHVPPFLSSTLRFALTAAVLIPFMRPKPGALGPLAIAGLLTALHFGIQTVGLWMARDLAPMIIAMQIWIPAAAVLASVFLKERIGAPRIAGIALSFVGIFVLAAAPSLVSQLGAFALVALASALYGAVSVYVRRAPGVHPLAFQAWIGLAALATLGPISAFTEHDHLATIEAAGWGPLAAIAFGAIASSVIANALMFSLVQKYEVARTTPYMFATPVIAIALGAVALGDKVTPQVLVGGAITMAGVAVAALAERRALRVVAKEAKS
jgi:O-acetylserine/cysteine efflux transporter